MISFQYFITNFVKGENSHIFTVRFFTEDSEEKAY
jgi:hypothetical protein